MKFNKFALVILAIFSFVIFTSCPVEQEENFGDNIEVNSAMEFAAGMRIGWNLGNTFDAWNGNLTPDVSAWGNRAPTQSLMNAVAAQGFEVVRIPVTWGTMIGSAPRYEIDPAWMDSVADAVRLVLEANMKAIINIHHDGADSHFWLSVRRNALTPEGKAEVDAKFKAVWTQIANKFKNYSNLLIFEGFNELHDGSWGYSGYNVPVEGSTPAYTVTNQDLNNQRARVNELNQIFVDTVRATGGNNSERFLLVQGLVTRPSETSASHFVMPQDTASDRLIAGIHFYDPSDFAIFDSQSPPVWGEKALPGNWANEKNVQNQFNPIKAKFIDNGIPVIIGEYGAIKHRNTAGKPYRLYYMEYVTKYAVDCGLIPVYWDNGSSGSGQDGFGLFNRTNGSLFPDAQDIINVMMKAAKTDYSITEVTPP